jgi:acyl carrier protein
MQDASELAKSAAENKALLAGLWREIIGVQDIFDESDFFQLGGDSLQMMTLLFRIHEGTGIELSPGDVFNNPTLILLATFLATEQMRTEATASEGTL